MHILILGGTVFLGRALVDAAQARGHTLTLFTRGQHNPDLYPELERLRGDRTGDMSALHGRRFDAVIDTSGYVPRVVRASAELLAPNTDHYTFISTISVYPEYSKIGIDEDDPVGSLEDPTVEEITGETYGPLKALCEQAVMEALPGRSLIIRPGLIVGPHDPSDRFTYWPVRVARGGRYLAPERADYLTQVIDVRDLAEWTIDLVDRRVTGVFNATGPEAPVPMGDLLAACREVARSDAEPVWVSAEFTTQQQIRPWMDLPLWVPEAPDTIGFSQVSIARALAEGLRFRPLKDTIADTLAWARTRPADYQWRAGLTSEREEAALAALDASTKD